VLFRFLFSATPVSSWTVFESPTPPSDRIDRAEGLRFIKDGFSFQAMLLAPLWLLTQRAFVEVALYGAIVLAIVAAAYALDVPYVHAALAVLGLHVLVGFEAGAIERSALRRRGYTQISEITGTSEHDAERRFLDIWLPMQRAVRGPSVPATGAATKPAVPAAVDNQRSPWSLSRLIGTKG
jgi:hypothetical protein